jgi:glycosyltransferase involved in cell wall biosynthesis
MIAAVRHAEAKHRNMAAPRPVRVLELRSVRGTGGGPDKTILLGAAQTDPDRYPTTVCYIRDTRDPEFALDRRAARLGVDYAEVLERSSFDWKVWPALRRLVRERSIDIVHGHDYKTDLLVLLLARAEGVVPLATAHGWSGDSLAERVYYFFDRRLLARFPAVIAVSEPIRQELIRCGCPPHRVRRVSNGIDPDHFRRRPGVREAVRSSLGIPAGSVVLGAVGRLEKEKRFDLLLETAARVETPLRPLVVLVGEGSCRDALTRQAAALGMADRLRLLGQRDDVREVHQAFDVYVQTSDTEGVPNAVLEAMALETPVVATDVGGTGELLGGGDCGLLVPRGDVAALAAAVGRVLSDPAAAVRRVRVARARVESELSFRARMQAVETIYEELMAGRRACSPQPC